jgi:hypothetical protein
MILHFSQIGFTDDLTFTAILLSPARPDWKQPGTPVRAYPGIYLSKVRYIGQPGLLLDKVHPVLQQSRYSIIASLNLKSKHFLPFFRPVPGA